MTEDLFNVPEGNMPALTKAIERLSKKSEKSGAGPITLSVIGQTMNKIGDGSIAVYNQVVISGNPIKHNGWTFVARIDHNDDSTGAKNLVYTAPGEICPPQFYNAPANCEHCGYNRKRRDTFILLNEATGEFKQIGRTCVQEFTDGLDPMIVAGHLERLKKAAEQAIESSQNIPLNNRRFIDLTIYLAYVSKCIRDFGWISTKDAYEASLTGVHKTSTRDAALNMMYNGSSNNQPATEDFQHAEDAMAWATTLDGDRNEYTHNVVTLATDGYGDYKAAGVAASIVRIYDNHLNRNKNVCSTNMPGYIGEVGKTIVGNVTLISNDVRTGSFGEYNLITMKASTGETLVTMGRFDPGLPGRTFKLKAKVKSHEEYRGVKQTHVNFCKIV